MNEKLKKLVNDPNTEWFYSFECEHEGDVRDQGDSRPCKQREDTGDRGQGSDTRERMDGRPSEKDRAKMICGSWFTGAGPARARPFSPRSFGKIRDSGEKSSEKARKSFLFGLLDFGLTFWYDMGMKGKDHEEAD